MTTVDNRHAYATSHTMPQFAAIMEGGMLVYRALNRGDTVSAILVAEWLRDCAEKRRRPDDAEQRLGDVARRIRDAS